MAILPVSSVNLDSNNRVGFRGDMEVAPLKRVDSDMEGKARTSVGKYATVPVVVLMTLNPSLSAQAAGSNAPEPKQITMEMPYAPSEASEAEPMYDFASEAAALSSPESAPQTSGVSSTKRSSYVAPDITQYERKFTALDGKKYTMYYTDYMKNTHNNKDIVMEIYFVPEDYKPINIGYRNDENIPPKMTGFLYHDIGKDKEFVGAKVVRHETYGEGYKKYSEIYEYEIPLPTDIANEIIDLITEKTKYTPSKQFIEMFETVTTPEIIKEHRIK